MLGVLERVGAVLARALGERDVELAQQRRGVDGGRVPVSMVLIVAIPGVFLVGHAIGDQLEGVQGLAGGEPGVVERPGGACFPVWLRARARALGSLEHAAVDQAVERLLDPLTGRRERALTKNTPAIGARRGVRNDAPQSVRGRLDHVHKTGS